MSIGLIKKNSIFAVEEEVTEGSYRAPQGTTSYFQVLEGFSMKPSREVIDRGLITGSPGKETPRLGIKSVVATMPVEMRASGVEGGDVDFSALLKNAFGAKRSLGTRVTTKNASHTSTVIGIEDADIASFNVGDIVCVLEDGAHEFRPITAKSSGSGTATITLGWALDNGAPSNSVEIAKFTTFYTASSGHAALSLSAYLANQIRMAGMGMKVNSLALENFQPGKVANWNFGLEGLDFSQIDGAAPHTPAYDTGVPPIILNACIWRDGSKIDVNSFTWNMSQELAFLETTCSPNGRTAGRVDGREITGQINPYKDDTSVDFFDDWEAGTEFSLFAVAYTPSSTDGEVSLGSAVCLWLPQCFATEYGVGDVNGVLTDELGFRCTRGAAGTSEEAYLGLI